uniref:Uncharacterized protein n=1 Tax=Lactuca sativa TaxID=4236 RepID=A0A9R1XHE7_LACSA|nr:hypothetical protein LSAT_V11C400197560 [Lactuca sativa]
MNIQYVAEVRRKDLKKCCPFELSSYSPESTFQAERVFASLILEDNDVLINTPENTQASNCKRPKLSEIQRDKLPYQKPIQNSSERKFCHPSSGCEIWVDALIFVRSISPPKLLNSENMLVFAGEVIGNDATSIINDTPLESASGKVTYADCQIEKVIYGDMVAAENDKPEDVVVVDHSLKDISLSTITILPQYEERYLRLIDPRSRIGRMTKVETVLEIVKENER